MALPAAFIGELVWKELLNALVDDHGAYVRVGTRFPDSIVFRVHKQSSRVIPPLYALVIEQISSRRRGITITKVRSITG